MPSFLENLASFKNRTISWLKDPVIHSWYTPDLHEGDSVKDAIVIRKKTQHAYVYDKDGNVIFHSPVSTGVNPGQKTKVGDSKTPVGKFNISYLTKNADKNIFNHNLFWGLNTKGWSGIGLHGNAHAPGQIGKPASHGCIRFPNDNVDKLHEIIGNGNNKIVYILDEDDKYKLGGKL